MDALIRHLTGTGTGDAKIAVARMAAGNRSIDECEGDVVRALNDRGFTATAEKVVAWCDANRQPAARQPVPATYVPARGRGRNKPEADSQTATTTSKEPINDAISSTDTDPRGDHSGIDDRD